LWSITALPWSFSLICSIWVDHNTKPSPSKPVGFATSPEGGAGIAKQ
jgi:hypothetical protein